MDKLKIKNEYLPTRCEICHQSDKFNEKTLICNRCMDLIINGDIDVKLFVEFKQSLMKLFVLMFLLPSFSIVIIMIFNRGLILFFPFIIIIFILQVIGMTIKYFKYKRIIKSVIPKKMKLFLIEETKNDDFPLYKGNLFDLDKINKNINDNKIKVSKPNWNIELILNKEIIVDVYNSNNQNKPIIIKTDFGILLNF